MSRQALIPTILLTSLLLSGCGGDGENAERMSYLSNSKPDESGSLVGPTTNPDCPDSRDLTEESLEIQKNLTDEELIPQTDLRVVVIPTKSQSGQSSITCNDPLFLEACVIRINEASAVNPYIRKWTITHEFFHLKSALSTPVTYGSPDNYYIEQGLLLFVNGHPINHFEEAYATDMTLRRFDFDQELIKHLETTTPHYLQMRNVYNRLKLMAGYELQARVSPTELLNTINGGQIDANQLTSLNALLNQYVSGTILMNEEELMIRIREIFFNIHLYESPLRVSVSFSNNLLKRI